jgi:hypothetical protein
MPTLYAIPQWAKAHPAGARALIAFLSALLALLGYATGFVIWDGGDDMPQVLLGAVLALAALLWAYPHRAGLSGKGYLHRRAPFDMSIHLLVCLAWMQVGMLAAADEAVRPASRAQAVSPFLAVANETARPAAQAEKPAPGRLRQALQLRKAFRAPFKQLRQTASPIREWPRGLQFLFLLLMSFLASVLSVILLALSCSLACSGSGAGALLIGILSGLVGLGSLALLIFAFIALFRPRGASPGQYSREGRKEIDG